ncbi:unnamed protein product [marine sediment metagenome]|uniref:Uncharacterized protein n=1 Tax=marine sediment metagenome TaxID=412755 RepID=X1RPC4_9ZZZZ
MQLELELAGQRWELSVPDEELQEVHLPVLREIRYPSITDGWLSPEK